MIGEVVLDTDHTNDQKIPQHLSMTSKKILNNTGIDIIYQWIIMIDYGGEFNLFRDFFGPA